MKTTYPLSIVLPMFALIVQPAVAADPDQPANLHSAAYSSTAAEIFWDRSNDDGIVVAYEIQRNDTLVDTIDALSYFDSSLSPATNYVYTVTAIDDEGNRSTIASTSLLTFSVADSSTLTAPTGLTASVYSRSAIELFWDRETEQALNYEIFRNGEIVDTTNGTSFFDDSLTADLTYDFGVVAVSADGSRSSAASITVATTNAVTNDETDTEPTDVTNLENLEIIVYSTTAAELFWDRVDSISSGASILRSGELIGTTAGNSFFDDTRVPGESYQYTVNATDSAGIVVATASIDSTSDDSSNDSTDDTGTVTETGTASSTAGVVCDYVDVTFNDSASVNATSTSEWSCSDIERMLVANGLPDHDVGVFPNQGNPNTITEQEVTVSYTLNPVETGTVTTLGGPAGPQGYVLNGVKIDAATAGSCDDSGTECSLVDNSGSWNIEALGQDSFDFGEDENNAHVQPGGIYHYHGMPEGFITKQGGGSSTMTLIGWAADGFPVYARYGYSDASDATSELISMSGSYQLVSDVDASRPSAETYALGTFAQDWQYIEGSGDLDACNGRLGVTPEFPGGIYHYYATDSYPYFQRCVTGEVEGGGRPPEGGAGAPVE